MFITITKYFVLLLYLIKTKYLKKCISQVYPKFFFRVNFLADLDLFCFI